MQIILDGLIFPEGPCFDEKGGIWLVEKDAGNLVWVNKNVSKRFNVEGAPNGIAIRNSIIWFCDSLQNSIRTFDPVLERTETVVNSIDNQPLKMPNDLAFDNYGNLLFTCPGDTLDDDTGYVCCLSKDKTLSVVFKGMYYPNGLAFNKEHSKLYMAETGTHRIWAFDWDALQQKLNNKTLFAETGGPVGPDGIAFDEDGNLYVAVYGSGQVKVWDAHGVKKESFYSAGRNPTNCAIDPLGIYGLVITEAEKGVLVRYPLTKRGIIK